MYQGLARSLSKFLIYSPKKVVKLERHVKAIHKSRSNFDFPSDSFKDKKTLQIVLLPNLGLARKARLQPLIKKLGSARLAQFFKKLVMEKFWKPSFF